MPRSSSTPTPAPSLYRDWTGATRRRRHARRSRPAAACVGEPVYLYMYNDTISNSGQGVHINSETGNDTTGDSVYQAVILNITFYNDGYRHPDRCPPALQQPGQLATPASTCWR